MVRQTLHLLLLLAVCLATPSSSVNSAGAAGAFHTQPILRCFDPLSPQNAGIGPSFKGPIGLQLYSLREQFSRDVPGTLDRVREMGFKYVELAGTNKLAPEQYKQDLEARGLKP